MIWVFVILIAVVISAFIAGVNFAQTERFQESIGHSVWKCPEDDCDFYISSNWYGPVEEVRSLHQAALHV